MSIVSHIQNVDKVRILVPRYEGAFQLNTLTSKKMLSDVYLSWILKQKRLHEFHPHN